MEMEEVPRQEEDKREMEEDSQVSDWPPSFCLGQNVRGEMRMDIMPRFMPPHPTPPNHTHTKSQNTNQKRLEGQNQVDLIV